MKSSKTRPISILGMIIACMIASGLIRIGSAGVAIANANTEIASGEQSENGFDAQTTEISMLMDDLRARADALEMREEDLAKREEIVQKSQEKIIQELENLKAAEQSLLNTITRVERASAEDVAGLVSVYEAMKPKDAALLFEQMEPDFAAGFLAEMSANAAAGIMSGLTSEKAYEVSVVLAGRNSKAARLNPIAPK